MTHRQAAPIAKLPVTWILVADGRTAQVHTRQKVERRVPMASNSRRNPVSESSVYESVPVSAMQWEAESAEQYETGRNATGMVFESAGSTRHMSAPHIDVHEEIKQHFARTIAKALNVAQTQKRFDRLVLVAPAKMLGEIKKHLSKKALKSMIAEMPKDLTHYQGHELTKHLESIA